MTKYEYKGNEDKVYIDVTGKKYFLSKGTIFEPKFKPNWDDIEERSVSKNKIMSRLDKEDKKNDSK